MPTHSSMYCRLIYPLPNDAKKSCSKQFNCGNGQSYRLRSALAGERSNCLPAQGSNVVLRKLKHKTNRTYTILIKDKMMSLLRYECVRDYLRQYCEDM